MQANLWSKIRTETAAFCSVAGMNQAFIIFAPLFSLNNPKCATAEQSHTLHGNYYSQAWANKRARKHRGGPRPRSLTAAARRSGTRESAAAHAPTGEAQKQTCGLRLLRLQTGGCSITIAINLSRLSHLASRKKNRESSHAGSALQRGRINQPAIIFTSA